MSLVRRLRERVPDRWARRWPTIRAILITYHVAAVLLLAFPAPAGVMNRSLWREATVQRELEAWAGHLRAAGLDVTSDGLEEGLWSASKRLLRIRREALRPFTEYERYAGVEQSWRMFSAPNRFPVRLEISIREPAGWRPVYTTHSDEHAWMRAWFDEHSLRRIVSMGGWEKNKERYRMLCDWIAQRAARDFPAASHVRVRQIRYRVPTPEEARAGVREADPSPQGVEVRPLRALREGDGERRSPTQVEAR